MIKYTKFFLTLIFICSISISYAEKLPFIGKISYSASGGSAYIETFEIKEDGSLTITGCGMTSCGLIYKGKYQPLLLPKDFKDLEGTTDIGYLFENDKIYYVDEFGQKIKANADDCFGEFIYNDQPDYCSVSTLSATD